MGYEVNVAKLNKNTNRYEHFFSTDEKRCTNYPLFEKVYDNLKKSFPEPEFKISAIKWEQAGQVIYK